MVEYPEALDSDSDDVSTALTVGASFWTRGEHDDALKWLRKAADEAFDAGQDDRGLELSKLAAALVSVIPPPPRPSVAPAPSVAPPAPPVAVSVAPPAPVSAAPPRPQAPVMVQSETATQEFAAAVVTRTEAPPPAEEPHAPTPQPSVTAASSVEGPAAPSASPRQTSVTPPSAQPKSALPRPVTTPSATSSSRPGARVGRPAGFAVKPGDATRSTAPTAAPSRTPPTSDDTTSVHDRETPVVDIGSAVRTSMGTGADLDLTQADAPRASFDRALLTPLGGAQRRMTPPRPAEPAVAKVEVVDELPTARLADPAVEALVHSAFPDAIAEPPDASPPSDDPRAAANEIKAPEVHAPPSPPRVRARLWNSTDAMRVAVSRQDSRIVLRTYDGIGLRDGEVEAVIIGLSGGTELAELLGGDADPPGEA